MLWSTFNTAVNRTYWTWALHATKHDTEPRAARSFYRLADADYLMLMLFTEPPTEYDLFGGTAFDVVLESVLLSNPIKIGQYQQPLAIHILTLLPYI